MEDDKYQKTSPKKYVISVKVTKEMFWELREANVKHQDIARDAWSDYLKKLKNSVKKV